MSSSNLDMVRGPYPELVPLPFKFTLDAANAPTLTFGKRVVKSVVRNSAGVFTVTLQDGWTVHCASDWSLQAATAIDLKPQGVTQNVTSSGGGAKTVKVRLLAVAVETDAPAKGTNATELSGILWVTNNGNASAI